MEIQEEIKNEICLLRLKGRLDAGSIKKIKDHIELLVRHHVIKIVLDMKNINFIDGLGLGSLVYCQRVVSRSGGDIGLVSLQDQVRTLFALTRIYRVFQIFDDPETAIKNI
jgi:anti-sigma B factor antagonist